jgi:mono/diheme cytochrome c family protein
MIIFLVFACAAVDSPEKTDTPLAVDTAGCPDATAGDGTPPQNLTGNAGCGGKAYQTGDCVTCHGPDGLGASAGPNLLEHVHCHTDDELYFVLDGGRPKMPDQNLGPQQSADMVAWLRLTFGAYTGPDDPNCPELTP